MRNAKTGLWSRGGEDCRGLSGPVSSLKVQLFFLAVLFILFKILVVNMDGNISQKLLKLTSKISSKTGSYFSFIPKLKIVSKLLLNLCFLIRLS